MLSMFETLRVEFGPEVHITIVTPGYIESEMNKGKYLSPEGKMTVDQEMRDVSYLFLSPSYILTNNVLLLLKLFFLSVRMPRFKLAQFLLKECKNARMQL